AAHAGEPRPGGARDDSRRGDGPRRAPRCRGGVQGRRARAARRCARRVERAAVDQRDAVRFAICEYGAGNVRSVELALERLDGLGDFYFAHSYAVATPYATAWSEGIVAEARSGSFVGCQFHPEKSGAAGARYLAGVVEEARSLSRV